jgi:hypothetical protein
MTNVKVHKKTNCLIYVQNKQIKKTNMVYINKWQPLNNRLLTWDRHIQNVCGLNMFAGWITCFWLCIQPANMFNLDTFCMCLSQVRSLLFSQQTCLTRIHSVCACPWDRHIQKVYGLNMFAGWIRGFWLGTGTYRMYPGGFAHCWKALPWPIVVNFYVIWSLVESCLIGNHTKSSYFYVLSVNMYFLVNISLS